VTRAATTTFAFAAEKGGIGKSTLVLNIAAAAALQGARALIVEAEPQGRLSTLLQVRDTPSLAAVLAREVPASDAIAATAIPHLSLLPGGPRISDIERHLAGTTGGEYRLLRTMEPVISSGRFDLILVDTPGDARGCIAAMAMIFARRVVAPLDLTDDGSLAGVIKVINIAADLNADGCYGIEVVGMLATRAKRSRVARELRESIASAPIDLPPVLGDPVPESAEFKNLAVDREVLATTSRVLSPTGERAREAIVDAAKLLTNGTLSRVDAPRTAA